MCRPIMSNHIYRSATFSNSEKSLDLRPLSVAASVSRVVATSVIPDHEPIAGVPERRFAAELGRPSLVPLAEIGRAIEGACLVRRYSRRTVNTYTWWARRFVMFHGCRHPAELDHRALTEFLTDLATQHQVAASTQNQALQAILFLYSAVLERPLPQGAITAVRAKRPLRLPTVLSREQVAAFFDHMSGVASLIAWLQ